MVPEKNERGLCEGFLGENWEFLMVGIVLRLCFNKDELEGQCIRCEVSITKITHYKFVYARVCGWPLPIVKYKFIPV